MGYTDRRRLLSAALGSPITLFRNGEAGVWHDPSDLATMYQDSAGTTPVLAAGDPVGLVLDKARGVSAQDIYGPELVTNGDFDDGSTGWSLGADWSVSGGVATKTAGTGNSISQSSVGSGGRYLVEFDLVVSSGHVQVRLGENTQSTIFTTSGRHSIIKQDAGTGVLYMYGNAAFAGSIDNISVRAFSRTLDGLGDELLSGPWATAVSYDNTTTGTGTSVSTTGGTTLSRSYLVVSGLTAGQTFKLDVTADSVSSGVLQAFLRDGTNPNAGTVLGSETSISTGSSASFLAVASSADIVVMLQSSDTGSDFSATVSVREIPGNHLIQDANDDYRPTLARHPDGGLRNLFTSPTENLSSWGATGGCTASIGNAVGPSGEVATTVTFNGGGDEQFNISAGESNPCNFSLFVRLVSGSPDNIKLGTRTASAEQITPTSEWQRFDVNQADSAFPRIGSSSTSCVVEVCNAQLEEGSTATAYQKVTSQYDVTEAGKRNLWYLDFDGVDDYMYVPTLDMSASDELTISAGLKKNVDTLRGIVAELSPNYFDNDGAFRLAAPGDAAQPRYQVAARGTIAAWANALTFPAPITNVVTGLVDISGDSLTMRVDGGVESSPTLDLGTGNWGASYALTVGSHPGGFWFFNGHLYGLIIRGRTSQDAEIAKTERYMARKTGVTL